jgi:hypothetical protein
VLVLSAQCICVVSTQGSTLTIFVKYLTYIRCLTSNLEEIYSVIEFTCIDYIWLQLNILLTPPPKKKNCDAPEWFETLGRKTSIRLVQKGWQLSTPSNPSGFKNLCSQLAVRLGEMWVHLLGHFFFQPKLFGHEIQMVNKYAPNLL